MTVRFSEQYPLMSVIDPDAAAVGTFTGDAIDMADFAGAVYHLAIGDMASSATVDYSIWSGTTSGGTYTAITAGSATQLTQAGTDADKQVVIEIDARAVLAKGHRYIKDRLVVLVDAVDSCAMGFGIRARYGPETDLASVDEIVDVP